MAGIPIVIIGTIRDNDSGEEKAVTITGLAGAQGVAPGHPLPEPPPGIWGPTDPFPGYGLPGPPPGIWGPNDPRPGWGLPPEGDGKPPEKLFDWKVGWTPDTGWVVVAVPKFDTPVPSK